MAMLDEIKKLVRKAIKNPITAGFVAYLMWKILNKYTNKEAYGNAYRILARKKGKELVYEPKIDRFAVIDGLNIFIFKTEEEARKKFNEGGNMEDNSLIESISEERYKEIVKEGLSYKEKLEALNLLNKIKLKEIDSRYQNPDGTFKKMTCPDNPEHESKFCGCVRFQMSQGKSKESAKKICAYIARMKGR